MKAKGLMVGDLIKTKNNFSVDNELNNKYCKVQLLGDKYIAAVLIDEPEKRPYGDEVSFEEIPLTAKILEKNGFKVPGHLVWNLGCGAEVQLVPETHDLQNPYLGYRLVVKQKVFGINDTVICHLKYVHQLQNALKLCEIEKEIII